MKTACILWDALGCKYYKISLRCNKAVQEHFEQSWAPGLSAFLVRPPSTCQSFIGLAFQDGCQKLPELHTSSHASTQKKSTTTYNNWKKKEILSFTPIGLLWTNHCDQRNACTDWLRSQNNHSDIETETLHPWRWRRCQFGEGIFA